MQHGPEPVAVGVVGAGRVASFRHLPILDANDRTTVAWIADVDGSRARRLARAYDCPAVTVTAGAGDVPAADVALLAIPVGSRGEYVRAFADRGTPVLAEKPFAPDRDTHRAYLRRHPAVACNYMRTRFSSLVQARDVLRSGSFGPLERIDLRESGKLGATGLAGDHYQADPAHPGSGLLLERGCHALSQLVALVPDDELRVEAATLERVEGLTVDVEASLRVVDAGVPVDLRLSAVEPVGTVARLVFDRATVRFDPASGRGLAVELDGSDRELAVEPDDRWAGTAAEAMYLRWNEFLDAVRDDGFDAPRESGLRVTELIDSIREVAGS